MQMTRTHLSEDKSMSISEYEKVDLVKRWRDKADDIGRVAGISTDAGKLRTCADELETWLAANLERIKAEARLEGEISEHKRTCQMYWHVCRGNDARCSEGYTCERLAALEAQAKEKP